jgi:hypothetical protein
MPRYNKKKHGSKNQILTSSSRNCSRAAIIKIQSKNTNSRNSAEKKRVTTTSQKQLIGRNKEKA